MDTTHPVETPTPAPGTSRGRKALVAIIVIVGLCQMLTTSGLELDWLPRWLGGVIAMTGFLTFLLLVGPFGNFAVAVALPVLARRRWRWPLWQSLLLSLPFWFVVYRLIPKPWP